MVVCSWTPAPFHKLRILVLRLFGAKVDWSAHVYSSVKIWMPTNLTMGPHSCLGPGVDCYCIAAIELGEYAVVSQRSYLCTGMHDIDDPDFQLKAKPIRIGAGAWIAAEAFVGPGVEVGERAVIGARCVLFKDAEPNGVYVGNPALLLRHRSL